MATRDIPSYAQILADIERMRAESEKLEEVKTLVDPGDMWVSATVSCSSSDFSTSGSPTFYSEPVSPFTESAIDEIKKTAYDKGRAAAYREITASPEMLLLTGITHGLSLEKIGKEVLRRGRSSNAHTKPVP